MGPEKKKISSRPKMRDYRSFFRPHAFGLSGALLLSFGGTVINYFIPQLLSNFVDKVSEKSQFGHILLIWFALWILCEFITFCSNFILLNSKIDIEKKMQMKLAGNISKAPTTSISRRSSEKLTETLVRDIDVVLTSLHRITALIFQALLGIAALLYTAKHSWQLCLLNLVMLVIILITQMVTIEKRNMANRAVHEESVSLRDLFQEALDAFSDLKVQSLLSNFKVHFVQKLTNVSLAKQESGKVEIKNSFLQNSISITSQALYLWASATLASTGYLSLEKFLALYLYRSNIYSLVGVAANFLRYKGDCNNALDRIGDILNNPEMAAQKWGKTREYGPTGEVVIENLSYHCNGKRILKDVNVEIPAGKVTVIIGPSGSGKTTILRILSRLYDNYGGSIKIKGSTNPDGTELSLLSSRSLEKAITLALQDPKLLSHLSLRENLKLAKEDATDQELLNVLSTVGALGFVQDLGGLDIKFANISKELSGGQIQRIALARPLLLRTPILLLDEVTSALDVESEHHVLSAVKNIAWKGHTVIMVAHRLEAIRLADFVVVMDNGTVADAGTPEELYNRNVYFQELFKK